MTVTLGPRLGLMLNAAAGDAHPNEFRDFLRGMDALCQISAKSRTTAAQPSSPTNGDTYILPASATGTAWGGKAAGTIAYYTTQQTITSGGTESTVSGWDFFTPKRGYIANVEDEGDACYRHNGSTWRVHYKEGAFTPAIAGSVTAGTHTYTTRVGRFTIVGNTLFFQLETALSAKDDAMSGIASVIGLPYTSAAYAMCSVLHSSLTLSTNYTEVIGQTSGASVLLTQCGSARAAQALGASSVSSSTFLRISGAYSL